MGKHMHACMHGGERKNGDVYACKRRQSQQTSLPNSGPPGLLPPPPAVPRGDSPPTCSPPLQLLMHHVLHGRWAGSCAEISC